MNSEMMKRMLIRAEGAGARGEGWRGETGWRSRNLPRGEGEVYEP